MLGGIVGSADVLHQHLEDDPRGIRFVTIILEAAQRAADLAGKLLGIFSTAGGRVDTPIDGHHVLLTRWKYYVIQLINGLWCN